MAKYKTIAENTMMSDAIALATMAHRAQIRKDPGKLPYIVHPLHVMQLLIEHGVTNKRILTAAVLHDVVEDTGVDMELINRQFGNEIADMVDCVTKTPIPDASDFSMHEKARMGHKDTMDKLDMTDGWSVPFNDDEHGHPGILLKIADRLSNLMGGFPKFWDIPKHIEYYEQSKEIAQLGYGPNGMWTITQDLLDAIQEYAIFIEERKTRV